MIRAAALLAIFVLVGCTLGQQGAFDLSTYGKAFAPRALPGTTGDGVADDTAALQASINGTPVGGTLDLSAGRYRITDTLIIDKPMVLMANGTVGVPGPGQIVQSNANKDALWIVAPAVIIKGIGIWGAGRDTGTGHGIVLAGPTFRTDDGRITSCWFTSIPSVAIDARGAQGYHISDNGIENSTIGLRIAYQTSVTDAGNNNVITANRFYGHTTAGVEVCNGKWNVIHSNIFDYCGTDVADTGAVWIHGPASSGMELRENSVCNNVFNVNGSNGVLIQSTSDTLVSGNLISRTQRRGILAISTASSDITNNTVRMSDRNDQAIYAGVELASCSDVRLIGNSSSSFAHGFGQLYGFKLSLSADITNGSNTGTPSRMAAFHSVAPVTMKSAESP